MLKLSGAMEEWFKAHLWTGRVPRTSCFFFTRYTAVLIRLHSVMHCPRFIGSQACGPHCDIMVVWLMGASSGFLLGVLLAVSERAKLHLA